MAALSLGADCPFPVILNGGYPTSRIPPAPPAYLQTREKNPVKRYISPPPYRLIHLESEQDFAFLDFAMLPFMVFTILFFLWTCVSVFIN